MSRPQRPEGSQGGLQPTWWVYLLRCGDDGAPSVKPKAERERRAMRGGIGG